LTRCSSFSLKDRHHGHSAVLPLVWVHRNIMSAPRAVRCRCGFPSQSAGFAGHRRAHQQIFRDYACSPRLRSSTPTCAAALRKSSVASASLWPERKKLPERVAVAFEDHFGIRPLEGYGCTEMFSPFVTVNTADFRAASFRQVGAKRGSIGHPLPGITVKIVDPENAPTAWHEPARPAARCAAPM